MPPIIEQVIAINRLAFVVRTNTPPRVASSSNVEVPVREFKIEENPSVGIFWYDSASHSLFGIRKQEVTPAQIETAACDGLRLSSILRRMKSQELVNPHIGLGLDGSLICIDEARYCLPVCTGPASNLPQAHFIYPVVVKYLLNKSLLALLIHLFILFLQ